MSDTCLRERRSVGRADRAIQLSTAGAVLAVAGVAAYISYWHAYAVVREYGETGLTARLEPATIDGLVYACSMVMLYAARHRCPVPSLARWLLTLGIVATLAANMAQGWSHGTVGGVVAAWPAASLVGSYELLVWIIRTSSAASLDRVPAEDQLVRSPDQPDAGSRTAAARVTTAGPRARTSQERTTTARRHGGPVPGHQVDQHSGTVGPSDSGGHDDTDAVAVAAYLASLQIGEPLSERKLAGMFGRTSRRWARNRIAEARAQEARMAA